MGQLLQQVGDNGIGLIERQNRPPLPVRFFRRIIGAEMPAAAFGAVERADRDQFRRGDDIVKPHRVAFPRQMQDRAKRLAHALAVPQHAQMRAHGLAQRHHVGVIVLGDDARSSSPSRPASSSVHPA
jgi:hypothetical protein